MNTQGVRYRQARVASASVMFTRNLRRHVDIERCEVSGSTVVLMLSEISKHHTRLRGYLPDDTGALRMHIAVLINGQSISNRHHTPHSEVLKGSKLVV